MAEKEIFNVFLQIGRNYASFLFECMRISQNLFLFGGEGGGGESISIFLSCSLSFLFLSFPAISSFFGTLSIVFLSHGISDAITFQETGNFI